MRKSKKLKMFYFVVAISVIAIIYAIADEYVIEKYNTITAAIYKAARTSTTEDGKFQYIELEDGNIEISKYIGTDTEVSIPTQIDGKNVTSIGNSAFLECASLATINIPEGVKSI